MHPLRAQVAQAPSYYCEITNASLATILGVASIAANNGTLGTTTTTLVPCPGAHSNRCPVLRPVLVRLANASSTQLPTGLVISANGRVIVSSGVKYFQFTVTNMTDATLTIPTTGGFTLQFIVL